MIVKMLGKSGMILWTPRPEAQVQTMLGTFVTMAPNTTMALERSLSRRIFSGVFSRVN